MEFSSKLLEQAIHQFELLPGVGRKTAQRFALHLLKLNQQDVEEFGQGIINLIQQVQFCSVCNNISDGPKCGICANTKRDESIICVVEDIDDVLIIENTAQFRGVYHVLGGKISPMDGIGPGDLKINELVQRVAEPHVSEVILALSTTMEGDTTNFYIYKKLQPFNKQITTIARGVAFGDELEYTDELTLGRSLVNRIPYEQSFKSA